MCKFTNKTFEDVVHYSCLVYNTTLLDDTAKVDINTQSIQHSNDSVTLLSYMDGNKLTFIPNSIFKTFPNLKIFIISNNTLLDNLRPGYFLYATRLVELEITGNPIEILNRYIFEEAARLKMINLHDNQIESIHWLAFQGLNNLLEINLKGNKIIKLEPATFSQLLSIGIVNMEDNLCINFQFTIINYNFSEIEKMIENNCEQNAEEVWVELSIVSLVVLAFIIMSFGVVKGSMWWSQQIETAIFQGMKYKGPPKKHDDTEETDTL